jgi:hypothetical protein
LPIFTRFAIDGSYPDLPFDIYKFLWG